MATNCNLADKINKCFDQFECPICKETFVDPRVLSCLHSFCNRCLKILLNTIARRDNIKCPVCKRVTKLPNGEVDNLQVNFIFNNLMSILDLHKKTQTKDSKAIKCEVKIDDKMDALKIWKEIKFSVLVNDQHGKAMLEPTADVSVVIKSPNSQNLDVTNRDDGSYHGVYIPHIPGVYRVFVTVSGAEIPGSPFEWYVKDSVNPKKTTLQMEAGKTGVVYNTLINQTRDFIVITRDSKGEQIREDGALINVEIKEPNKLNSNVVPVQDYRDGRFTFSYKPVCVGNYQVSVKVNGNNIRDSPFTWGVEQWHLVARDRENSGLIFSQGNMTVERSGGGIAVGSCGFTGGCHSWKVKAVSGGERCAVGVTGCNVEPVQQEYTCYWVYGPYESRYLVCIGKHTVRKPSSIPEFNSNDVIIVYLDIDMTLTVHHLASDKTDTFTLEKTTLYPCFGFSWFSYENNKLTLLV